MNLPRNRDRLTHIKKEFKKVGISNYEIVKAYDGLYNLPNSENMIKNIGKPDLEKEVIKMNEMLKESGKIGPQIYGSKKRDYFKPGEIGHYITYYNIIKKAIKEKYKIFVIAEDDVVFSDDFEKEFEKVYKNLPEKWKAISLGWEKHTDVMKGCKINNYVVRPYAKNMYKDIGTEFMIFNRKGAKRILKHMTPMMIQTDKYIDFLNNIDYVYLCISKKVLTKQKDYKSDIQ